MGQKRIYVPVSDADHAWICEEAERTQVPVAQLSARLLRDAVTAVRPPTRVAWVRAATPPIAQES